MLKIQWHLSTMILAIPLCGVIGWLNARAIRDSKFSVLLVYNYGWPLTFLQENITRSGIDRHWWTGQLILDAFLFLFFLLIEILFIEFITSFICRSEFLRPKL